MRTAESIAALPSVKLFAPSYISVVSVEAAAVTVSVAELLLMLDNVAVIIAVPAATPVATPLTAIMAAAVFEDAQVTEEVTF